MTDAIGAGLTAEQRAGVERTVAALLEAGDLDRLVALARIAGGAADMLSDDIIARLAEIAGEALVLIDRLARSVLAERLVTLADAVDRAALREQAASAPAGGLGGLWRILRDPASQAALRFALAVLGELRGGA